MGFFSKKHHLKIIKKSFFFLRKSFPVILGLVFFTFASANFSSTNFELENPVTVIEGGQSSSSSFQYFSNTGQLTNGQSTSTNFAQNAGFLYFPTASSPAVSATPGSGQVVLTWTPAVGILANITSYEVGISTVSGGTFTYTAVGNVLTSTRTSLSNGTTYFFKVRSFAAGILLSESAQVSATPTAGSGTGVTWGGGGGGGGGVGVGVTGSDTTTTDTGVVFSGRAYPLSKVSILKDGQIALSTIAGPDSNFTGTLGGLSSGEYTFSVYGEDKNGIRSTPFTFQIFITSGVTTKISGIFIAPTIAVDKSEVKKGDNIVIFGQSTPTSDIVISVNSEQEFFENALSDASGVYLHTFDTSVLELGKHSTKSKALLHNGEISTFGEAVGFIVGTKNVSADNTKKNLKCDANTDNRCNLVDFSIAAFWYKKKDPPAKVDFNNDGIVNLIDFSIMAFYWTG